MLQRRGSDLADVIRRRYGYNQGYETVLNILRLGANSDVPRQVADAGAALRPTASTRDWRPPTSCGKSACSACSSVSNLTLAAGRGRWFRKRLSSIYLFSMLRHANFPVFAGFCQYEPNVLKITPPLDVSPDEIRQACATMIDVLQTATPQGARRAPRWPDQSILFSEKNP